MKQLSEPIELDGVTPEAVRDCIVDTVNLGMRHDGRSNLPAHFVGWLVQENDRLRAALAAAQAGVDNDTFAALEAASFMIDEITDLEGREGLTDYEFAEQVIALAHSKRDQIRAALAAAQAGDAGEPSVYETPDLHGRAGAIRKDGLAEGSPADPFIRGAFHDESIRRSGFAAGIEAAAQELKRYADLAARVRALRPPAGTAEPEKELHGAHVSLSASEPVGPSEDTVAVPRRWLEQARDALDGDLPRGRIGDAVFIMRGQINDMLTR